MGVTESRQWWAPHPEGLAGFNVGGVEKAFHDACRQLGVRFAGEFDPSLRHRHRSGPVLLANGARLWLKVGGTYKLPNHHMDGEISAFANGFQPKPQLVEQLEWADETTTWLALLMTYVETPAVERQTFAGPAARSISDAWIDKLKTTLSRLGELPHSRVRLTGESVSVLIGRHFGDVASALPMGETTTVHGDLNWANMTSPELTLLDWELWGGAPRGYDIGYILAFSVTQPSLVRRLEEAFAAELRRPEMAGARLGPIASLLNAVEAGLCSPALRAPLMEMASRILADFTAPAAPA